MRGTVIPNTARLIAECRSRNVENVFARIACLKPDGRDRSLSQKKPGFNHLLLPKDDPDGRIVPELAPREDEVTFIKTTDSALTGTNASGAPEHGDHERRGLRDLHRPVRLLHGAQPCR